MNVGIKNRHTAQANLWKDPHNGRPRHNGTSENGSVSSYDGEVVCTLTLRGPAADVEKAKRAVEQVLFYGNNLADLITFSNAEPEPRKIVRSLALTGTADDIRKAHLVIDLALHERRELAKLISYNSNSRRLEISGSPDEVKKVQNIIEFLLDQRALRKTSAIFYLPVFLDGSRVIHELGERRFRAVYFGPKGRCEGMSYCASKNVDDALISILKWGCEVTATDEGDGWLAVHEDVLSPVDEYGLQEPLFPKLEVGRSDDDYDIPDIVQFASTRFYCKEGSPTVAIEVVRAGHCAGRATVDYHTEDGSAKACVKYVPTEGTLTFIPGVARQTFEVTLLENDSFDTTLDFHALLNNSVGAVLGRHLHNCQVIIIDNDTFPSNSNADLLRSGKVNEIDHWALVSSYLMMNLTEKRFLFRVLQAMVCDQLANLSMIYNVFLFNYMMDEVLSPPDGRSPPDDAVHRVGVITLLQLAPWFVIWLTSLYKVSLKIQGIATERLQSNFFRTALRYSHQSWASVPTSDLVMAITRDVPQVVESLFPHFLGFFGKMGRLVILAFTIFWQIRNNGTKEISISAALLVGFVVILLIFLRLRETGTTRRREAEFRSETDIVALVQQVGATSQLITDYSQQSSVVHMFMMKVKNICDAKNRLAVWSVTNVLFAPFLSTVTVGIYTYVACRDVLDGGPIGEFLSGICMWWNIGECFQGMYTDFLEMSNGIAPLQNVTYYMNLQLRSLDDMRANAYTLNTGRAMMEKCQHERFTGHYAWNELPLIEARDISFAYKHARVGRNQILDKASFILPQSKVIGVIGNRGCGKATLLKLLGGAMSPDSGDLFTPPHLRVLHVGLPAQLMGELNIFENICFGPSDGDDEKPERVLRIIKRLGLDQWIEEVIAQESSVSDFELHRVAASRSTLDHHHYQKKKVNSCLSREGTASFGTGLSAVLRQEHLTKNKQHAMFSQSQLMSIHIARALVMNPDLMVIHQPWSMLDEATGPLVTKLLREFVDFRGVENPPELLHERKLRSLVFTSNKERKFIDADILVTLADKKVTREDFFKAPQDTSMSRKAIEVPKADVLATSVVDKWAVPDIAMEAGSRYSRLS